jgi:hypothetical protein
LPAAGDFLTNRASVRTAVDAVKRGMVVAEKKPFVNALVDRIGKRWPDPPPRWRKTAKTPIYNGGRLTRQWAGVMRLVVVTTTAR